MAEILLTSEAFVKSVSSISDNLQSKYLLPSIREAQEVHLKGILGDALLSRLKQLMKDNQLDGKYKELVDNCQYYLAYMSVIETSNKVVYKLSNAGVHKTMDENIQSVTQDELAKMQYYYQSKADSYCQTLQNYLLENRSDFPELSENHCRKIRANLYSSASCGIFLGGARGRRRR